MRKLLAALVLVATLMLPVPAAHAATPRFQIRCSTSHLAQVDPIVSPGTRSAHMHEFFGNTATNANSTYRSMLGGRTTCTAPADTAGYWVPTLISPGGQVVRARTILLYYRGVQGARTVAFPANLRMVSHNSQVGGASSSNLTIKFPSCWDGARHRQRRPHLPHGQRHGPGLPALAPR